MIMTLPFVPYVLYLTRQILVIKFFHEFVQIYRRLRNFPGFDTRNSGDLLLLFDRFLFLPDIVETMRRDDGISRSCDAEGRRTKFVKFREAPRELNGMGVLLGRGHLICKCIVQARRLATTAVHPVTGAGGGQRDQYFNLHLKLLKGWQPPPCSPALLFQTDLLRNKCLGRNRCSMNRRFY